MKNNVNRYLRLSDLVEGTVVGHDMVSRLATVVVMQARIVVAELQECVLPALLPADRTGVRLLSRALERNDLFNDALLSEIEAVLDILRERVEAGTRLGWEPDDGHIRGGYQVVRQDEGVAALSVAAGELDLLHDALCATLAAARAMREAEQLLEI